MKKCIATLVIIFVIYSVQAMEQLVQDGKHYFVARYLCKHPHGRTREETDQIDNFFVSTSENSEKVKKWIDTITGFSLADTNGVISKLAYYNKNVLIDEFIEVTTRDFFRRMLFITKIGQSSYLKAEKHFKDDILLLMSNEKAEMIINYEKYIEENKRGFPGLRCQRLLKKDWRKDVNSAVSLFRRKKDYLEKEPEAMLIYEFIKQEADHFFKFGGSRIRPFDLTRRLKIDARESFMQDLLLLIKGGEAGIINHEKYVNYDASALELNYTEPFTKNRLEAIKKRVFLFNEKKARIAAKPFVLRLAEGLDFLPKIKYCYFSVSGSAGWNIDLKAVEQLSVKECQWVNQLMLGSSGCIPLVKFTPELVVRYKKLPTNVRNCDAIKNIKIDIKSKQPTFVDNLILYGPITIVSLIPDLLIHNSDRIGSKAVGAVVMSEFLWCFFRVFSLIDSSGFLGGMVDKIPCMSSGVGDYILPRLDARFHSHVALLKSFFGTDKVRVNIKYGRLFCYASTLHWILSLLGRGLFSFQSLPLKAGGLSFYFTKICVYLIVYSCCPSYCMWDNPIERGKPQGEPGQKGQSDLKSDYVLGDFI